MSLVPMGNPAREAIISREHRHSTVILAQTACSPVLFFIFSFIEGFGTLATASFCVAFIGGFVACALVSNTFFGKKTTDPEC